MCEIGNNEPLSSHDRERKQYVSCERCRVNDVVVLKKTPTENKINEKYSVLMKRTCPGVEYECLGETVNFIPFKLLTKQRGTGTEIVFLYLFYL